MRHAKCDPRTSRRVMLRLGDLAAKGLQARFRAASPVPPAISLCCCARPAGHVSVAAVLKPVADDVLIHTSEFCQSNAVVVRGQAGVLLIDAGVLDDELACIANDIR